MHHPSRLLVSTALVLTVFSGTATAGDCQAVGSEPRAIIPKGVSMIRQTLSSNDTYRAWWLNGTNWPLERGGYPYQGLGFKANVSEYSADDAQYELQVTQEAATLNKRFFFVKFRNLNLDKTLEEYYINSGDGCTKMESKDALTTDVVLYEYAP